MITEKPIGDRVSEIMKIMNEIKSLNIPLDAPEVAELRLHCNAYIKEGLCWSGNISFLRFGRIAEVDLPRRADKYVSVNLRLPRAGGK